MAKLDSLLILLKKDVDKFIKVFPTETDITIGDAIRLKNNTDNDLAKDLITEFIKKKFDKNI